MKHESKTLGLLLFFGMKKTLGLDALVIIIEVGCKGYSDNKKRH